MPIHFPWKCVQPVSFNHFIQSIFITYIADHQLMRTRLKGWEKGSENWTLTIRDPFPLTSSCHFPNSNKIHLFSESLTFLTRTEMEKLTSKVHISSCIIPVTLYVHLVAEFIQGVSQFSVKGDKESKLRCELLYSIRYTNNNHDVLLMQLHSEFMTWTMMDSFQTGNCFKSSK